MPDELNLLAIRENQFKRAMLFCSVELLTTSDCFSEVGVEAESAVLPNNAVDLAAPTLVELRLLYIAKVV